MFFLLKNQQWTGAYFYLSIRLASHTCHSPRTCHAYWYSISYRLSVNHMVWSTSTTHRHYQYWNEAIARYTYILYIPHILYIIRECVCRPSRQLTRPPGCWLTPPRVAPTPPLFRWLMPVISDRRRVAISHRSTLAFIANSTHTYHIYSLLVLLNNLDPKL